MKFTRRPESITSDWRTDKALVKTQERLAELGRFIEKAADRIAALSNAVTDADQQVHRAEIEVLAGRATDAQLAAKQQSHLEARTAHAREVLAVEDAKVEQADLEAKLPAIRKKAKAAAHAAFQAKSLVLLRELRSHLAAAVQAEAELQLLRNEAEGQFPLYAVRDPKQPEHYDPDFQPCAGVPDLTSVTFNRQVGILESITIQSRNAGVLHDIDEALTRLDPQ